MNRMKTEKIIGLLLVLGAISVFIPYTILTAIFDYPGILREDAGVVLTRFHAGGAQLIWVWWAFAILGLPLLIAYILLGQYLEGKWRWAKVATTLGVISGIVQIIGLLRWTFVVPVLANSFVNADNEATKESIKVVFQAVHQFGGVLLGEHIGQLFTIAWTVMMSAAFSKLNLIPRWAVVLGYFASAIYLLAQADLFATVMPGFPVWDLAGLVGSTLWLIWLVVAGLQLWRGDQRRTTTKMP